MSAREGKVIELFEESSDGRFEGRLLVPQPIWIKAGLAARPGTTGEPEPGSFKSRVLDRKVDLVELIDEGVPRTEYLPESEGMLAKGKRHLIAAPRKEGKSLAMLVHGAKMALAGARVIFFDRENGSHLYAERLDEILTSWKVTEAERDRIGSNLVYYEFPQLRQEDADESLVKLAEGADVVVFDSQRPFLTEWGLKEGDADDYAQFMLYAVDPLFRAGVATVILDNTGHREQDRSRGTSAKGDLNEVVFSLKKVEPFSKDRAGKLQLVLEHSRFGGEGRWEMRIGGGRFPGWKRIGGLPAAPAFRQAVEELLQAAGEPGLSKNRLLTKVREKGVLFKNEDGSARLDAYDRDAHDPVEKGAGPRRASVFRWKKGS